MKKLSISIFLLICLFSVALKLDAQEESFCEILWHDAIFGKEVGVNNSLYAYDYDNDSIDEIITIAYAPFYGYYGYWYILKHNPETNEYQKVHVSDTYEGEMQKMILGDTNGDGNKEIIFSIQNTVHVVSLVDFSTLGMITLTDLNLNYNKAYEIVLADVDQDGQTEIIIANRINLAIINSNTLELENEYEINTSRFDVGNVDADPQVEIVFAHGLTLEIAPDGTLIEEFDFRPDFDETEGFILLQDTDGDQVEEAFISDEMEYLYSFNPIDGTTNFEVDIGNNVNSMILHDVTGDSIKEIICGDVFIGNLYCLDAVTGEEYWEINIFPAYNAVGGIAFGDFDNDQSEEIAWGTLDGSGQYIYVYHANAIAQTEEWKSIARDGPFYIVEIIDIDEDGDMEIITGSKSSDSESSCGIVTVFDAVTKEKEFQMDDLSDSNYDSKCMAFYDYQNDGDLDMILVSKESFSESLRVFDGDTYELEAYHDFNGNDYNFQTVEVGDVDNDGEEELIITSNSVIRIVNSQTFQTEWVSQEIGGVFGHINIVDVVGDADKEIVVGRNQIYIIKHTNNNNYSVSNSLEENFRITNVVDWDNDGDLEIIAGLDNGIIKILDPATLEVIETFPLGDEAINGIEVVDINNDGVEEIFIAADNHIFSVFDSENFVISQKINKVVGMHDGFKIVDYNNDGNYSIFSGSVNGTLEFDANCLLNLDANILENSLRNNGNISIFPNPAIDQFTINYSGNEPIDEVMLYTLDGKLIPIEPVINFSNSMSLNLPDLNSGIYLLRVKINDVYQFKKFVVE